MIHKKRIKLTIEYDGTNYYGWQTQKGLPTIQETVEIAIKNFFGNNHDIKLSGAGRTDAKVHAIGQIAHFDIEYSRNYTEWQIMSGINNYLRGSLISIVKVEFVDDDFHARFSAKKKSYIYKIINRYPFLTFQQNQAWLVMKKININKMYDASRYLLGYHDFTSFRGPDCQSITPFKTIDEINISYVENSNQNDITIEFIGKSFLHNQIRIMIGTLKKIAISDDLKPEIMKDILESKNRMKAGETAPGCGLYLNWIKY